LYASQEEHSRRAEYQERRDGDDSAPQASLGWSNMHFDAGDREDPEGERARTPLTTAVQYRARTGLMSAKSSAIPAAVERTTMP
jgi:hypothetical protein